MTRQELIQSLEQHCQETEADLAVSKQALNLLRNGIYAPGVAKKLRSGPIVYGNGHHDGKKKHPGSSTGTNSLVHAATIQSRKVIEQMLRVNPNGLTTKQMAEGVTKAGITITPSTIHNALRALKPIRLGGTNGKGGKAEVYALPNIQ